MKIKRAAPFGAIGYISLILLLITIGTLFYTYNKYKEIKELNNTLHLTINEQIETIEDLKAENANLISELDEKNRQIEERIPKTITSRAKDISIPTITPVTEETSNNTYLGNFKISAYCHCVKCCGKSDGITASGTKVQANRTIAVDPKIIPLGSKVVIDGKTYVAEDTGGAIKGNRIDMYFSTHQEALNWGIQYKDVSLIK